MENYIINFSYDIPKYIIGKPNEKNPLGRKDLLRALIEGEAINLDFPFHINWDHPKKDFHIASLVKSTIIFASHKSIDEIARILNPFKDRLYLVLTEVHEQPDTYFARILGDYDQQLGIVNEVDEILNEE